MGNSQYSGSVLLDKLIAISKQKAFKSSVKTYLENSGPEFSTISEAGFSSMKNDMELGEVLHGLYSNAPANRTKHKPIRNSVQ
jgi:hypothetical protein